MKMHEWECPRGTFRWSHAATFFIQGCRICLEQTSSVGGRNSNKTINCLCKSAKKCFLLQRREVTKRRKGVWSLGTSLHLEVEDLQIYWKAKQYFRNSIIFWFLHSLQFYRINVTCICKRLVRSIFSFVVTVLSIVSTNSVLSHPVDEIESSLIFLKDCLIWFNSTCYLVTAICR